jgi:hypothetical protein
VFSASNEKVYVLAKIPNRIVGIRLSIEAGRQSYFDLIFELSATYPNEVPKLKISSDDFSRQKTDLLAVKIMEELKSTVALGKHLL